MTTIELIRDQLQRSFEKESWHGSAVLELLEPVDHKMVSFRPASEVHTIWELVLHMATWKRVVADRIEGRKNVPTDEQDWPDAGKGTAARWRSAVQSLRAAHRQLEAAAERVDAREIEKAPPAGRFTRAQLLHGVIQHDLYHAGQIAILRKIAGASG